MENLGKLDRTVRGLAGFVMLLAYFQTNDFRGIGLAGTLLMITAVLGYCPFYGLLGKSSLSNLTHPAKEHIVH